MIMKMEIVTIRSSAKVRYNHHVVGVTFLKGIQSSGQAPETLPPHMQKSREGGQANNCPRAKVFG